MGALPLRMRRGGAPPFLLVFCELATRPVISSPNSELHVSDTLRRRAYVHAWSETQTTPERNRSVKQWTVWVDYYTSGEGRTLLACVSHAETEAEARAGFASEFDQYYVSGADAQEGVQENEVTKAL